MTNFSSDLTLLNKVNYHLPTFLHKFTTQGQRKHDFPMALHRKYYKEGAIVIIQILIFFIFYFYIAKIIIK